MQRILAQHARVSSLQVSKTNTATLNKQWIFWYAKACRGWVNTENLRNLMEGELALERKKDQLFHLLLEKDKSHNPINETYLTKTISGDLAEVKNHILDAFYGKVLKVYKSPPSGTQDLEEYDANYLKDFNSYIKKNSQLQDFSKKREKKESQHQSDIDDMVKIETFHLPVLCWFGNFTRDGSWLFVTNSSNKISPGDKSLLPKNVINNTGRASVLAHDKEVIAATNRTASPSFSYTSNTNSNTRSNNNNNQGTIGNVVGGHVQVFLKRSLIIEEKKAISFAESNKSTVLRNAIDGCTDPSRKSMMQSELERLALKLLNKDMEIDVTGSDNANEDDDDYEIAAVPVQTVSKVLATNKVINKVSTTNKVDASYIDDNFKGYLNKYGHALLDFSENKDKDFYCNTIKLGYSHLEIEGIYSIKLKSTTDLPDHVTEEIRGYFEQFKDVIIVSLNKGNEVEQSKKRKGNALEKFNAIVKVDDTQFTLVEDIDATGGVYSIYKYENYVDSQPDSQN